MLEILSDYFEEVDSVLEENPILRLEKLLEDHRSVTPGEITQLSIKMKKQWNNYAKYGLEMCIVLTEEECDGEELVYNMISRKILRRLFRMVIEVRKSII